MSWFFEHQLGIFRYGVNGLESFDYSQISAALSVEGVEDAGAIFKRLLIIERGFMGEINRQRNAK